MGNRKHSHIIVLGQGIAGLMAAVVLGEAGYPVQVLGRRYPAAGGLQLSPNGFRALATLGLEEAVLGRAVRLNAVVIKSLSTNRHLTEIIHQPEQKHAAIARQDVLDLLDSRAETIPHIRFTDTDLHALHLGTDSAQVVAGDGQLFTADEVIGADGANGLARTAITGQSQINDQDKRVASYRAMRAEVDAGLLPAALRRPSTTLMLGDGCHLVSYPIAGGARNNLVFCASADQLSSCWAQRFFAQNPVLSCLASPSLTWFDTPLYPAKTLPVWRCPQLTLIGDAAHVMPPHLAQGAGQTFVDGACLKAQLAQHPLSDALSQMAAIRAPQMQTITQKASASGRVMRLSGPASKARNIFIDLAGPRFMNAWLTDVWQAES